MADPKTWPPKDPDAVLDYLYTIPLDEGDSVVDHAFAKLSGDVVVDSEARSGADVTAWLSGGTDGETAVFRISWETTAGRHDDAIITLPVAANEPTALVLTGYAKPTAAHLAARYPAFAAVSPATIGAWLVDAERFVDASWTEGDYAPAVMALAAHNMAIGGLGTGGAASSGLPAGVTRVRTGSLELAFSDSLAAAQATGSLASTRYGAEFLALQRRNRGGPRVMGTGALPTGTGARYPHGQA